MNSSERENLLNNINFIIENTYRHGKTDTGSRLTKKDIIEDMDMSYVTYLKLRKNLSSETPYTPQDGTLFKFVECFNRNWLPEITVSTLKRKDLGQEVDAGVYTRREHASDKLNWYSGCYFCYYFTRRSRGLRYGIMNIYHHNTEYYVQMITGFSKEYDMDILLDNSPDDENLELRRRRRPHHMKRFFSTPSGVGEKFHMFLYGRSSKDIKYYYYTGKIELFEHSLLLNLFPENPSSYKKMIAIKRQLTSRQPEYQGGLGAEMTLAHEIHSAYSNSLRFIGISRDYITDTDSIESILHIDAGNGENLDLSTKDYVWFNLAVGRDMSSLPDINL